MAQVMPQYDTKIFTQVWGDADSFVNYYQNNGIKTTISVELARTLYYLLYARFGNNPIVNLDENQFKYKCMTVIFSYGPTWSKRLDIQEKLRTMSEEDLRIGSKAIYNHAFNPSTEPSTDTLEEIGTINEQTANKQKRGRLESYSLLWDMLSTDVTTAFLDKFKVLFKKFVGDEYPVLYEGDN